MSLFASPDEHAANPPSSWVVRKAAERCWHVVLASGAGPLSSHKTKRDAEEAIRSGFEVRLYEQERRWYAGEPVAGWKPYQPR